MSQRSKQRLCEALKADFKAAPGTEDGPFTAGQLGNDCDGKSDDWVWKTLRGESNPSILDLIRWERSTGGFAALDWIARQLGRTTIPLPSNGDPTLHEIAEVLQASGELIHEAAQAYEDGRIDEHEALMRSHFDEQCLALVRAAMSLKARYDADAERVLRGPRTMADAEAREPRRARM